MRALASPLARLASLTLASATRAHPHCHVSSTRFNRLSTLACPAARHSAHALPAALSAAFSGSSSLASSPPPSADDSPARKRAKMAAAGDAAADAAATGSGSAAGARRIGTHSGTFHCDEAMGCFLLRRTEKFKDADVTRTRDEKTLATLDAVIDVGGVYDPATDRYDHHQKDFKEVFGHGFSTKLSSAGLVYKHYGEEVVAALMGLPKDHAHVRKVYLAVYRSFMEALDANDNGINQFESDKPPRYVITTHLPARVGRFNPDWLDHCSKDGEDAAFQKAMALAGRSSWRP
ncbi:hypothetical protein CLOP_g15522 [Closterium sp. NIES-67]|nr:hypothetical protein CLOP_g15522 [Closterium sp. NIES-67]